MMDQPRLSRPAGFKKVWAMSRRVVGGMAARTHVVLFVLAISAVSAWLITISPHPTSVRFLTGVSAGFNLIWMFSFAGPPVVLASVVAVLVAVVGVPRRVGLTTSLLAVLGVSCGLILLRVTEPSGEHIFG